MIPKTRAECVNGPRPCPHTTCRHHLGESRSGSDCSLDFADRGPISAARVAQLAGVSRREVARITRAFCETYPELAEYLKERAAR